jgi:hypothetical protein
MHKKNGKDGAKRRSLLKHTKAGCIKDPLTRLAQKRPILRSIDAMVVGHLMREGCITSASLLTKEAKITQLVDKEVFQSAKKVIKGLRMHDCKPALAWSKTLKKP